MNIISLYFVVVGYILVLFKNNVYIYVTLINEINYCIKRTIIYMETTYSEYLNWLYHYSSYRFNIQVLRVILKRIVNIYISFRKRDILS